MSTYSRAYYLSHREEILAKQKLRDAEHREERKTYLQTYQAKIPASERARYQRELRRRLRGRVIDALGGKCVHCGFDDPRALQIDHVHGDGHEERKTNAKNHPGYYKRILMEIEEGSDRYQLLCANCNWIKRHENGEDH